MDEPRNESTEPTEADAGEGTEPVSDAVVSDGVAVEKVETTSIEAISEPTSDEAAPLPDKPQKRRPVWLHLIVLFFQILLLTPLYAAIAAAAVGAGVGWHYFDGSAALDLELVARPDIGALVKDAKGRIIGRAGSMNRILLAREQIPPLFVDALVAAEDQRFFAHPGFDPLGSVRAAWANFRAESIREGGSTLTQQLARDVYRLEGKDIDRKLSEIAAAVRIGRSFLRNRRTMQIEPV